MKRSSIPLLLMLGVVSFSIVACQRTKPAAAPSVQEKRTELPDPVEEKRTTLNRIRQDESLLIERTLVDDQNQLGLVFDAGVAPDKVEGLMRKVMTEMGREFPKEDIALSVYQSASPPRKIGLAQINGQTGEITYKPL